MFIIDMNNNFIYFLQQTLHRFRMEPIIDSVGGLLW